MLRTTNTTGANSTNQLWAGDYTWPYTPQPFNPYIGDTWKVYTSYPQGWECPKCHRVNAPTNLQCQCSYEITYDSCSLCGSKSNLTAHGTKHICGRCNLKLIDAAIKEVESRECDGKTIVGE